MNGDQTKRSWCNLMLTPIAATDSTALGCLAAFDNGTSAKIIGTDGVSVIAQYALRSRRPDGSPDYYFADTDAVHSDRTPDAWAVSVAVLRLDDGTSEHDEKLDYFRTRQEAVAMAASIRAALFTL